MRFFFLLLAALAVPALAQDQGLQRQLIQRQQQSEKPTRRRNCGRMNVRKPKTKGAR